MRERERGRRRDVEEGDVMAKVVKLEEKKEIRQILKREWKEICVYVCENS